MLIPSSINFSIPHFSIYQLYQSHWVRTYGIPYTVCPCIPPTWYGTARWPVVAVANKKSRRRADVSRVCVSWRRAGVPCVTACVCVCVCVCQGGALTWHDVAQWCQEVRVCSPMACRWPPPLNGHELLFVRECCESGNRNQRQHSGILTG